MLQTAIQYKGIFAWLRQYESQYKYSLSESDWEFARKIYKKLKLFYTVTELFLGINYPTANLYFTKIYQIKLALREWLFEDEVIHEMAMKMLDKYDKY